MSSPWIYVQMDKDRVTCPATFIECYSQEMDLMAGTEYWVFWSPVESDMPESFRSVQGKIIRVTADVIKRSLGKPPAGYYKSTLLAVKETEEAVEEYIEEMRFSKHTQSKSTISHLNKRGQTGSSKASSEVNHQDGPSKSQIKNLRAMAVKRNMAAVEDECPAPPQKLGRIDDKEGDSVKRLEKKMESQDTLLKGTKVPMENTKTGIFDSLEKQKKRGKESLKKIEEPVEVAGQKTVKKVQEVTIEKGKVPMKGDGKETIEKSEDEEMGQDGKEEIVKEKEHMTEKKEDEEEEDIQILKQKDGGQASGEEKKKEKDSKRSKSQQSKQSVPKDKSDENESEMSTSQSDDPFDDSEGSTFSSRSSKASKRSTRKRGMNVN